MRRFLAQLRDAYRAQGPRLLLAAGRWLVRPTYLVIVRPIARGGPALQGHDDVRWAPLREEDVPVMLAMSPTLTEAEIRRLWAEGQECLTCWIDGEPVFYRWDTTGSAYLPYLDRTFLPRPGDLLGSKAYTHPAYRNRGLLSASTRIVAPRAAERGAARVVVLVAEWNAPSLHAARVKIRHTLAGTVGIWQLGPWRRSFATGAMRLVGRTGFRVEELRGE